jgi:GNAT superfamily N-acetyltransferase
MTIHIREGNVELLSEYAAIPISFQVDRLLRPTLVNGGLGGILLNEESVTPPQIKDYDAYESPLQWAQKFDLRKWRVLLALRADRPVGGATLAFDTPDIHMLTGRQDVAALWDIRVHPNERGHGIGSMLFRESAAWARARKCRQLKAETQNVNVAACRFYARQGCHLGEINYYAYADQPAVATEVMLVWYLDL